MFQNIREGDRQAFNDFYFSHHAKLYHYIIRYTKNEWLAEETVQLSFVKLWETRENLSTTYSLSAQLFRIAKSILIDLLRKQSVRKTVPLQPEAEVYNLPATSGTTYQEAKNDLEYTLRVIKEMPAIQQKVFSYSRIEDFSHKEIADKLSISPKTVETHISRANKRLRKIFFLFFG